MLTITSTQIKQQTHLLDKVKDEEMLITKRDKPFAVIISIDRYNELIGENKKLQTNKKPEALELLGGYELGGGSYAQTKADSSDA